MKDEGKLIFTLPMGYRPKYFTGFCLGDDPADGGLMVYQSGEVRYFGPERDDTAGWTYPTLENGWTNVRTEYGMQLDSGEIAHWPRYTLTQYQVLAEKIPGAQVVYRLVGEWQDYTGERSDPVE